MSKLPCSHVVFAPFEFFCGSQEQDERRDDVCRGGAGSGPLVKRQGSPHGASVWSCIEMLDMCSDDCL